MQRGDEALPWCAPGPGATLQYHKGKEKGIEDQMLHRRGYNLFLLKKKFPLTDSIRTLTGTVSPPNNHSGEQWCDVWTSCPSDYK